MLSTPTCEKCKEFKLNGCKCRKHPDGVPGEIIFIPIEELRLKCDKFSEIGLDEE